MTRRSNGLRAAGVLGVLALAACNAITGVDSLHFDRGAGGTGGGSSGGTGGVSSGTGGSDTGGSGSGGVQPGTGGANGGTGGAAGGTSTSDGGVACGLRYTSTTCAACASMSCCDLATTCAGNAECSAFRDCLHGCGDGACVQGCYRDHQCGLDDWFAYSDCTDSSCSVACGAAPSDAGAGVPRDASSGATADGGSVSPPAREAGAAPDASSCPGSPCDPVLQCGCGAGQACVVSDVATGATSCQAPGPSAANGACSRTADCAAGTGCVDGVCKPFCNSAADCQAGAHCYAVTHDAPGCRGVTVPGWGYCTAACDPTHPGGTCGAGVNCATVATDTKGSRVTDCVTGGTGVGVGACTTAQDCVPGSNCVTYTLEGSTSTTCTRWCKIGFASDCDPGSQCFGYDTPVTIGGYTYGYCATRCDPMNPAAACGDGACEIFSDNGTSATDCLQRTGNGIGPGACDKNSRYGCAQGYSCVKYTDGYACEPWCKTTSPSCASGTTCNGLTPVTVAGAVYSTCH